MIRELDTILLARITPESLPEWRAVRGVVRRSSEQECASARTDSPDFRHQCVAAFS